MPSSRLSIAQLLQQGQACHQQGQWDRAAAHYREVIERQPRSFEALHLLGVLTLQTGNAADAVALLQQAARINPAHAPTHMLLGVALQSTGDKENSLVCFEQATKLDPRNPEFHYNFGKALRAAERLDQALASYERALTLNPASTETLNNISELLVALNRPDEALAKVDEALRLRPDYAEALSNRGRALLALERPDDALTCLDRALALNPDMPKVMNSKALALSKLRRFDDAMEWADQALARIPDYSDAHFIRGCLLTEMQRLKDAVIEFDHVLSKNPNHLEALISRGAALLHINRYADARVDLEKAISIDHQNHMAHFNLASLLLLLGEFETGWREYAWGWGCPEFRGLRPPFTKPPWTGQSTTDHLLVWGEQGMGDQILFASMLNDAAARTGKLTIAIERRLHSLFQRSFPGCGITTLESALENQNFDVQCAFGDLGAISRKTAADLIAHRKAYLSADVNAAAKIRENLHQSGQARICGLSWSSVHKSVGNKKSMSLSDLAPVLSLPGNLFVDLQYGDTSAERTALAASSGLHLTRVESVDNWHDIDGLAALIAACDVIITISNTTAHLAGALGKQVFLMLPHAQGRFWCWQVERSDALWYPNVRIFRQPQDGDWASVLAQVREALAALPPASSQ